MTKARGQVTLPEERQGWLRSMLMRHYEGNQAFREDWSLHLSRYKRLIKALVHPSVGAPRHHWAEHYAYDDKAWQALEVAIDRGPVETTVGGEQRVSTRGREYMVRKSRNTHLRRYRQELIDLCNRWGLRCEWAPAWLHASYVGRVRGSTSAEELAALDQESFRLRRFRSLGMWGGGSHIRIDIRIDIPYDPVFDDWDDVVKRIVEEATRQGNEIRTQFVQASFSLKKKRPSLALHVDWLYLAICPQPDTGKPLGWSEIGRFRDWGKGPYLTPSAVQKGVEPLAAELGLELPDDLKAGRPPKY